MSMTDVGVITAAKNEAGNLPKLYQSILNQSLKPKEWVIVNDNSTDGTRDLINSWANDLEWIKAVHLEDRAEYDIGKKYSEVLAAGYDSLNNNIHDYYMILDGDMRLTECYIEELSKYMSGTNLAICSFGIYYENEGELILENRSNRHPAGGATLYDGEFYNEISGPPLTPCVDSVSEAKARIREFECEHHVHQTEKAIQSRPTGEGMNHLQWGLSLGRDNCMLGYHPLLSIAKSINIIIKKSPIKGVGYLIGYSKQYVSEGSVIDDDEVYEYYKKDKIREYI